jgi:hypothetical protein
MPCYLISLETSGNQAYVYSSNKLRDVVGASELIYRVGTSFVQEAIEIATGRYPNLEAITTAEPAIEEHLNSGDPVIEVVIATSGKAVLLANSPETAKNFITAWSELVTENAPGVDALAVYSDKEINMKAKLDDTDGFITAFKDAGKNFSVLKSRRALVASRFQRIPVVAQCSFSGFPAEGLGGGGNQPVSRITRGKLEARGSRKFEDRIRQLFNSEGHVRHDDKIAALSGKGLEALEKSEWIAVVHADGNGLGQVFTTLDASVKAICGDSANGRDYVNYYRNFSNALDNISASAFRETVKEIFGENGLAGVVPIVVGGDDLTVVMDGHRAIEFTKRYMEKFCDLTGACEEISSVLSVNKNQTKRLGMCGGVCITKPHFPFSASYRLAEELMQKAKTVKQIGSDCIAIDFHILYDSIATSIDDIRAKLIDEGERYSRTAKPYGIYFGDHQPGPWETVHSYAMFEKATRAITAKDDDRKTRNLPSSQAHAIRDSLFSEHLPTQENEWKYLMGKKNYKAFAEAWREAMRSDNGQSDEEGSLYLNANFGDDKPTHYTYFLDALEAEEFFKTSEDLADGRRGR